ncbi:hypothetical protein OZX73_03355 [Bifidobacterium sp. ESL0775]|uniref:hypothetical protein n=1 Tax=Bifidobacterium sp. ESL0775 TaxID=2983230 RepID=UPI0023F73AEE|nr:hypothetical protein [Bifidobacterium sp. ESL0775]WEV69911.1 hypothetical protein OZX73_03355 [Bifidobacterium sp. ESL0775]
MKAESPIRFERSARHHYDELSLSDSIVLEMIAKGMIYYAFLDPKDLSTPEVNRPLPVIFLTCWMPPDTLGSGIAEILLYLDGNHTTVFHVEQLTQVWERYWRAHDPEAGEKLRALR